MNDTMLADAFLEHYSWVPGVVVAVVLFALTWLFNLKLRQRDRKSKTFDYWVFSDVAILSHRPEDSQLKVTYLDQELDNPRIVSVMFINNGTEVIRASEVLDQFVVSVGDAWLVSVEMVRSSSPNLARFEAAISESRHEIRLTLATLNPGDSFTLQMLVDHEGMTEISVSGRIEGESRPSGRILTIPETVHVNNSPWIPAFVSAILIGAAAAATFADKNRVIADILAVFLLLLGLWSGFGVWLSFKARRRSAKSDVIEEL
jgi:hypothetical protein